MLATPAAFTTASGVRHTVQLRVADDFLSRMRGLMFSRMRAQDEAFLLKQCTSVHTCFMRYALDLAYLDAEGRITQCVSQLAPWRMHWAQRRRGALTARPVHTLELQPGTLQRLGLKPGDQLHLI